LDAVFFIQVADLVYHRRKAYIIKGGIPPLYLISPFEAAFFCDLMIFNTLC